MPAWLLLDFPISCVPSVKPVSVITKVADVNVPGTPIFSIFQLRAFSKEDNVEASAVVAPVSETVTLTTGLLDALTLFKLIGR